MKSSVTTNYADSVRRTGFSNLPGVTPPIAEATVVRFDNVAQYWIDQDAHRSYATLADFPCLAPPFEVTWLETQRPRIHHGQPVFNLAYGNGSQSVLVPERYAVLLMARKAEDEVGTPPPPGAHWALLAHLVVDSPAIPTYGLPHPNTRSGATHLKLHGNVWFGEYLFFLDSEGKALSSGPTYCTATKRPDLLLPLDPHGRRMAIAAEAQGYSRLYMQLLVGPALFTVALMHCKNVTTQVASVPAKFAKRYQKRHGVPPSRHRTINITSMTKVINQHMGTTGRTLVQSLHICRGHFKDFSTGNGLFGRLRGRYWWSSQVRGTAATGTITHDYTVSP